MDLSPPAEGGPYSHWVKARAQRNKVTLPFLNASMASTGRLAPADFRPTRGGGKKILQTLRLGGKLTFLSAGAHGLAYRATDADFHPQLFTLLTADRIGSPLSVPRSVVIKVHLLEDYDDIDAARRECKMQAWLHNQKTTFQGIKVCGSEVVPPVFYAGLLEGNEAMGMAFITVMGEAPGQPLSSFLKQKKHLSALQYALIERAILTLWVLGAVHADLHTGNMFIDDKSRRVTIIDFGYAMVLPKGMGKKVKTALNKGADLELLWNSKTVGLQKYVNAIQGGREFAWYNPEAKAARYFQTLVDNQSTINSGRAAAWGRRRNSGSVYTTAPSSPVQVRRRRTRRK